MKKRLIMFFVVLTMLIATTCMLTACGGDIYKEGNTIVDVQDVETHTDSSGNVIENITTDKAIEVKYILGGNAYLILKGNKTNEMALTGYVGDIESFNLMDIEKSVKVDGKAISVNRIESGAFQGNSTLKSVDLTKFNQSLDFLIGDQAFSYCNALTKVVLPTNIYSDYNMIGQYAFAGDTALTEVANTEKFPTIGNSAFEDCTSIESFVFSTKTTVVHQKAFYNAEKLTNVTYSPDTVSIADRAFSGTHLTSVDFATMPKLMSIGNSAFAKTDITEVNIPDNVINIDDGAFVNTKITSVNIPFLGNSPEYDGYTRSWNFNDVYSYDYSDEIVTDPEDPSIELMPNIHPLTVNVRRSGTIPSGVFNDSPVTNVNIEFIPVGKYEYTSYDIIPRPQDNGIVVEQLVDLGKEEFEITADSFDKVISDYAFANAYLLEKLNIKDIVAIREYAFQNTVRLTDISNVLTDKVVNVEDHAFDGSGVISVSMPILAGETPLFGINVFANCDNLRELTLSEIPSGSIIDYFTGESSNNTIEKVVLGENITEIPSRFFENMYALSAVDFNGEIANIGYDAFYNCESMPTYDDKLFVVNDWIISSASLANNFVIPASTKGFAENAISSANYFYYYGTEAAFQALPNAPATTINIVDEYNLVVKDGITYYLEVPGETSKVVVLGVDVDDVTITIPETVTMGGKDYKVDTLGSNIIINDKNKAINLSKNIKEIKYKSFNNKISNVNYAGTSTEWSAITGHANATGTINYEMTPDKMYTYEIYVNGTKTDTIKDYYLDYSYQPEGLLINTIEYKVGEDVISMPYRANTGTYDVAVKVDVTVTGLMINNNFDNTFVMDLSKTSFVADNVGSATESVAKIEFTAIGDIQIGYAISGKIANRNKVTATLTSTDVTSVLDVYINTSSSTPVTDLSLLDGDVISVTFDRPYTLFIVETGTEVVNIDIDFVH